MGPVMKKFLCFYVAVVKKFQLANTLQAFAVWFQSKETMPGMKRDCGGAAG